MAFIGQDIQGQLQSDFWQYGTEYAQSMLWGFWKYWTLFVEIIALPFTELCVGVVYFIYHQTGMTNLLLQFIKRAPTILFIYKFSTSMYTNRSEERKQVGVHIEDVELQIQIVGTKLVVGEAKVEERLEEVNRNGDELRRMRLRVRGVIASDEELMRIMHQDLRFETDSDTYSSHVQEEQDIILEMFQTANQPERKSDRLDSGEPIPQDDFSIDNSLYSSVNESHGPNDCKVKIVRVTNVYKVAYLRHFIKQKRIRKSNKQAQLRKRMEGVKKLLEDWQKSLNMVINRKMSNLKGDQVEVASQEAMGDYSKPSLTSSDSECEGKIPEMCDENDSHWNHQYKKSDYTFEDGDAKEDNYMRDYYSPMKCSQRLPLYALIEETKSQLAVAGSMNDSDNNDNDHAP